MLAYTLHKHSPSTPLIILYTPETLPEPAVKAFQAEAKHTNIILHPVDHVRLPTAEGEEKHSIVAERFIDTWTKLRVFGILEVQGRKIDRMCFLDADMMIFSDPSPHIFNAENDTYLDSGDRRMCATHICVCNLDHDSWAPSSWIPENCAYTHLNSPDAVADVKSNPDTMAQMNTGMFVFRPSGAMQSFVFDTFHNMPQGELRTLKFPDQDFLNIVFEGRWSALSWRTNALKTWRYWHPNIWRDDHVTVLHYIVDKPWAACVGQKEDGGLVAGYKGDDGATHSWWWDVFMEWKQKREGQGEKELLDTTEKYVAGEDGESEEMRAIGAGAQDYAQKWDGKGKGGARTESRCSGEDDGQQDFGQGPHGPILRKPMLGERGHGRVARGGRGL